MIEVLTQEALTKKQIFDYLIKKPNIIEKKSMMPRILELDVENEERSLKPYVQIINSENKGLEIHLTYSLNPIKKRLIEKVFSGNENIKVIYPLDEQHSTRVSRKIEELKDVDDILNLATKYHEIANSEDYDKISKNYRESIDNLANELVDSLVKI